MNIIKLTKSAIGNFQTVYKNSLALRSTIRAASIFAVAGLEVRSKEWWEKRGKKMSDISALSYDELDKMVSEERIFLRSLKRQRKIAKKRK
ncbi:MAG: hypothetical protein H8E12_06205 [Rhodobacteraceae bacterium]|nr:hypothetical protein [Paracoccaceae bacterium]